MLQGVHLHHVEVEAGAAFLAKRINDARDKGGLAVAARPVEQDILSVANRPRQLTLNLDAIIEVIARDNGPE